MVMMTYNEFAGYRETIESLRQQLASCDAEVANLAALGSSYLNRANAAEQEVDSLCQQLADTKLVLGQAMTTVDDLQKSNIKLRDLLRPFAALLQEHNSKGPDEQPIFQINDAKITRGDLRRALDATEQPR